MVVELIIKAGELETLKVIRLEKGVNLEVALDDIIRTVLEKAAGATKTEEETVHFIVSVILATSSNSLLSIMIAAIHAFLPPWLPVLISEFIMVLKKLLPVFIIGMDKFIRVCNAPFPGLPNRFRCKNVHEPSVSRKSMTRDHEKQD
jgi:hypothetical protein